MRIRCAVRMEGCGGLHEAMVLVEGGGGGCAVL